MWRAECAAYYYTLVDPDEREIVAYHWHPESRSPIEAPHLHLGAGARVGRPDLAAAHLPSGMVTLQDVVRLAIRDFGVHPRRLDWARVLDETRAATGR